MMLLSVQLLPSFRTRTIYKAYNISSCLKRTLATISPDPPITSRAPQTVIEKVVQKYAVDLPEGKVVKAGDYVMIQPEHVMTHDNTGPVISKCVPYVFFPHMN